MKSKQQVLQLKPPSLCLQTLMVGLCVLALSIYSVQTATCPASVSNSLATIIEQYTFTRCTYVVLTGVVASPVSNNMYYMYRLHISASQYTAVRREDAFGSQTWVISFAFSLVYKSLAVDAAEQSVYLSANLYPMVVLKLAASTGAIVSQHKL